MSKGQAGVTGQEAVEVVANVSTMGFGKHFAMGIGESINKLTPGDELMTVAQHQRILAAQQSTQAAVVPVQKLIEGLDEISALSRYLRQGGCDSTDLRGLEEGLTHAIDMATEMLSMLAAAPAQGQQVECQECERLRMQLVACGVVALSNTPESAAKARDMHPDYMSASCQDVMRAVDSEMALRAALAASAEGVKP